MSPTPSFFSSAAAGLLHRRDDGTPVSGQPYQIPALGIAGIVLLVLVVLTTCGIGWYFLRRRQRRLRATHGDGRDSFVPNNFKVIGGLYTQRRSRAPSLGNDTGPGSGSGGKRGSTYAPTTEYGQYRPPVPKPAYFAAGGAHGNKHSSAVLVKHARDKSLPQLP